MFITGMARLPLVIPALPCPVITAQSQGRTRTAREQAAIPASLCHDSGLLATIACSHDRQTTVTADRLKAYSALSRCAGCTAMGHFRIRANLFAVGPVVRYSQN